MPSVKTALSQYFDITLNISELIKVRENRRHNHEWTIQRHWQHLAHKIQDTGRRQTGQICCRSTNLTCQVVKAN